MSSFNLYTDIEGLRATIAEQKAVIDEQKADIERLNQMLRETGQGQGAIDAYVAQCEELEQLRRTLSAIAKQDLPVEWAKAVGNAAEAEGTA